MAKLISLTHNLLKISPVILLAIFVAGCGNEDESRGAARYGLSYVTDLCVNTSSTDRILLNITSDRKLFARPTARGIDNFSLYRDKDSAFCKRKSSFEIATYLYDYKLLNYSGDGLSSNFLLAMRWDAVSNFQYNLLSLCHIPRKIIISPRVSYSFFNWIGNIITIFIDTCLALVMLFVGPVIGFICHPIESLANLTVGCLYFSEYGMEQYWTYIKHVNLIASIWDTLKGCFMMLFNALCFWIF